MARYLRGNVGEELTIGTLAATTVVGIGFDEALGEEGILTSLVATWSMMDWTPLADVGPLIVGVAHSDYSDLEIEATMETTGSWDRGNTVEQELTKRMIRKVGVFVNNEGTPVVGQFLNDGRPIKTKLNWRLTTGDTLKLWAYNTGTAAFATTSPTVVVYGHVNIFST